MTFTPKKIKVANYVMVRIHPEVRDKLKKLAFKDERTLTKYLNKKLTELINEKN